jgi:hypothetical protein
MIVPAFAAALGAIAMAAAAQPMPMHMPGMAMPGSHAPKATHKPAKKHHARKAQKPTAAEKPKAAAAPMSMPTAHHATMPMPQSPSGSSAPMPGMSGLGRAMGTGPDMGSKQMPGMDMGSKPMPMSAALGSYPAAREADGTAWQPDASTPMTGPMVMSGGWMLMAHGTMDLVADHQSGPRGDDKTFVSGMVMGMAQHPLGDGTVQFRAMISPDPLMGATGYPLLLAAGETPNGRTLLIDRQHPHDFFMELSGSVSRTIAPKTSVFIYAGLPGEPAFGPPSFMHRESIMDSPEAPITHHWLDSTHITFGVATVGLVRDRVKIEASRFNAREPDQHRWNIETGPLDSTAIRASWNPTRTLALQGSWGHFASPEQLEPGVNQTRWSASALWADDIAPGWHSAATLAWGRKSSHGHGDDAIAAEASLKHAGWTLFGRGEWIENRELLGLVDSPAYKLGKVSLGAARDFRIADHWSLAAGGLLSVNFVPTALAPLYGSDNPAGAMLFVGLKLD